jgi:UDP-N-acetylglucosamine--N-acetylmuramyl-(pentapeptide) pyrophosphoryl-undecaprenol N-acetylglucosamine transferase
MQAYFPEDKIIFTGNPVRSDFMHTEGKRAEALAYYELDPTKKTIVIIGGSLGARTLNNAMRENTDLIAAHPNVQILWQCGRFYEFEFNNCDTAQLPHVQIRAFIDRMDLLYAAADVVISRAGALSISELCMVGKPAILVPSPNVAEDHQTKNALALVEKGAARIVRDVDASEKMLPEAYMILENEALGFGLAESIHQLSRPKAAEAIALSVLKLAEKQYEAKPKRIQNKPV